jgi:hypothetical protein
MTAKMPSSAHLVFGFLQRLLQHFNLVHALLVLGDLPLASLSLALHGLQLDLQCFELAFVRRLDLDT